jgi:hypothetical protein
VGAELVQWDRRTDSHFEPNSRFSQFCESAKKSKKSYLTLLHELHEVCETSSSVFSLLYLLSFGPELSALFYSVPPEPITMSAVCASSTLYRSTAATAPPTGKAKVKKLNFTL